MIIQRVEQQMLNQAGVMTFQVTLWAVSEGGMQNAA